MLDMPTTAVKETATVSVEAWEIKFRQAANDALTGVIEIMEPRHLFAELQPMDAANLLAEATPQSRSLFTIVWIPTGGGVSASIEHDAEAWLLGGQIVGNRTAVRAGVRTVRVFWTLGRALIYASPENISSALDAVVRYTVAECDTIVLENEMDWTWAAIEADASLTHSITAKRQLRQSHVDAMTVTVTYMKAKFLRITRALEQLDRSLEDSSKRIYAELVLASALYDRLELLEDPVQFALDHYEIVNTRLGEARFGYREQRDAMIGHLSQAAIVLLLLYALHLFW
jgi:hypothetical protein